MIPKLFLIEIFCYSLFMEVFLTFSHPVISSTRLHFGIYVVQYIY
jgi:hypothetical protein